MIGENYILRPLNYEKLAKIQTDLALICKREIDLADLSKAEGISSVEDLDCKIIYAIVTSHLDEFKSFAEENGWTMGMFYLENAPVSRKTALFYPL